MTKSKQFVCVEYNGIKGLVSKPEMKALESSFINGKINLSWFYDKTILDSCCSTKSYNIGETGSNIYNKFLKNYNGNYIIFKSCTPASGTAKYYEIWVEYNLASGGIYYVFNIEFDKSPLENEDAKVISLKYSHTSL